MKHGPFKKNISQVTSAHHTGRVSGAGDGVSSNGAPGRGLSDIPPRGSVMSAPKAKKRPLSHDIAALMIRVAAMAAVFLILFAFIFEVYREGDNNMAPAVCEGDMVVVYRLDKRYHSQDLAAFSYEGKYHCARVVALPGDVVDIDPDGLLVNGSHQYEPKITKKTEPFVDGVTYPLTVPEGQIFVLGDNRTDATDSRVLGCLKTDQTEGKVVGIFRRRNF